MTECEEELPGWGQVRLSPACSTTPLSTGRAAPTAKTAGRSHPRCCCRGDTGRAGHVDS